MTERNGRLTALRGRSLSNVALVVCSVVFALGLTEVVLEHYFPVRGMIYQLDSRYLYRYIPRSRKLVSSDDHRTQVVRINDDGRLGDESGLSRASRRVVVYGDSFIAAERTSDNARFEIIRLVESTYERWTTGPLPSQAHAGNSTETELALDRQEYEEYVVRHDNVVRNLLGDWYDADLSLEPDSAEARYKVQLMTRVIEHIRSLVATNNAELLWLIIPESCDVGVVCDMSAARRQHPGYHPSGLTDVLDSIAQGAGIASLDLFEPFKHAQPSNLYVPNDPHWNTAGQLLAARLTADLIQRSRLLSRNEPAK